jgi:hypothetical protein
MGIVQETLRNVGRGLRRSTGLTEEPRIKVAPFRMMLTDDEQNKLENWSADKLLQGLVSTNTDTRAIASVAYDLVGALGDSEAAATIVKGAARVWSKARVQMSLAAVLLLRVNKDGSKKSEEKPFIEFCSKTGFDIRSVTEGQIRDYFSKNPLQELDGGLDAFKLGARVSNN